MMLIRAAIAAIALLLMSMLFPFFALAQDAVTDALGGGLDPTTVTTLAGASILNAIVMGVIIKAWDPDEATKDRFGPLLALFVAVFLVEFFTLTQGGDLVAGLITGIVVGGGSMGVHDVVGSVQTPPKDTSL